MIIFAVLDSIRVINVEGSVVIANDNITGSGVVLAQRLEKCIKSITQSAPYIYLIGFVDVAGIFLSARSFMYVSLLSSTRSC